jgi:hypothetical protein
MQRILCAVCIALMASACSDAKPGSEVEKLEKYTESPPPQQSRPQIKFYAESEGTLRPIEKEIQTMHERMKAGFKPSSAKEAALLILETAALTARAKVNELKKVGAADWEPLKPSIEESLNQVNKYYAEYNAAQ